MKFTGEYLDPTNLYHLRARQYDPSAGRFVSPDPVDSPIQASRTSGYAYVADRPTVNTDPSGQCFWLCGVVGAVVSEAFYVGNATIGGQGFSWGGAAQAAGEGFVEGATGGYVAKVTGAFLKGALVPETAGVVSSVVGGGVGGAVVTQTSSLFGGCGFASVKNTVQGALAGAASAIGGERFYPGTVWASGVAGSAVTYQVAVGPCGGGVGANSK